MTVSAERINRAAADIGRPAITNYDLVVGAELRRIRTSLGMSLDQVERESGGRWKGVVVGSYERADRQITVKRHAELLAFYGRLDGQAYRPAVLRRNEVVVSGDVGQDAAVRAVFGVDLGDGEEPVQVRDGAAAQRLVDTIPGARLVHRLVQTGPWQTPGGAS